jgi:hypothetical protein
VEELEVVALAGTEIEAEVLCSVLRSAGIECMHRLTDRGAGAGDGISFGGPREVLVRRGDTDAARELLDSQRS